MEKSELLDLVTCCICLEVAVNPYDCSKCFCLICYECKSQLNNSKCPTCRELDSLRLNNFAKKIVHKLSCKCKHIILRSQFTLGPNDCEKELTYGDLKSHIEKCEKRQYECNLDSQCTFSGTKKEFLDHIITEHDNKVLKLTSKSLDSKNT